MTSKRTAQAPPPAPRGRAKSSKPSTHIGEDKQNEPDASSDEKIEESSQAEVPETTAPPPAKARNSTKPTKSNTQKQKPKDKTEKEPSGTKKLARKPTDSVEQQRKAERKITGVDSDEDLPPIPAYLQSKIGDIQVGDKNSAVILNLGVKPKSLFNSGGSLAQGIPAVTPPPGTVKPSDVFKQVPSGNSGGSPTGDLSAPRAGDAPQTAGKFVTTIGRNTLDGQQLRNLRFALTSMQDAAREGLAILDTGGDPIGVVRPFYEFTKPLFDDYLGNKFSASRRVRADSDVEVLPEMPKKMKISSKPPEVRDEREGHGYPSIHELWEALPPLSKQWLASNHKVDLAVVKKRLFDSTSFAAFVAQMFIWSFPREEWLKLDDQWPGDDQEARTQLSVFYRQLEVISARLDWRAPTGIRRIVTYTRSNARQADKNTKMRAKLAEVERPEPSQQPLPERPPAPQ